MSFDTTPVLTPYWDFLFRITKNTHAYFREISTGRIAIADQSGDTPDKTEDGILYLDWSCPILVHLDSDQKEYILLPLVNPAGKKCQTIISTKEMLYVSAALGFPVKSGQNEYKIIKHE